MRLALAEAQHARNWVKSRWARWRSGTGPSSAAATTGGDGRDPLAHAEVLALHEAARAVGGWRLSGVTLFVTLEPCLMCAGAMVLARVDRLVYAAADPKAGAVASVFRCWRNPASTPRAGGRRRAAEEAGAAPGVLPRVA